MEVIIKERKLIIFLCVLVFTTSVLNFFFPVLRFADHTHNLIYMALIFSIPFFITMYGFLVKNIFLKAIALLLGSVVTILSLVFLVVIIMSIGLITKDGHNPAFEKIDSFHTEHYQVNTYRTNGGATTSFGVVARQEKEIMPGILLVKDIYKEYPRYDITCELSDDYLVIDSRKYKLKESVY